jgi:very-short-patch-repair endonuclease
VFDPSIQNLILDQGGVVTRSQLLATGMSRGEIAARLASGKWQRIHSGIYATYSGPLSRESTLWAAVLACGSGATLSHETAAELADLTKSHTTPIHVTIPHTRHIAPKMYIELHRTKNVAAVRHPCRLPPQTRIEETVLDLTQTARFLEQAIGWMSDACQQHLTTTSRLLQAIEGRSRLRWRRELVEALSDIQTGCHSILELLYHRKVETAHQLPQSQLQLPGQAAGGKIYHDVAYRRWKLLIELDGRTHHHAAQYAKDRRRDNANTIGGFMVLRYGWTDVKGHPCQTAAQVGRALQDRGWPGTTAPCGPTCALLHRP